MILSRTQTAIALTLIAVFFGFTLLHASWLAEEPAGRPKLIAGNAVALPTGTDGCIIDPEAGYGASLPAADIRMLQAAIGNGAGGINVPVEYGSGAPNIPRLFKTECPADSARPRALLSDAPAALSSAELYIRVDTPDTIPTPSNIPALLAAIPPATKAVFYGSDDAVSAIRAVRPDSAAFSIKQARACTAAYKSSGWMGSVPEICNGTAALLTLDDLGITLWGWPNRFLARMKTANVRMIIAQDVQGEKITGLTTPEQYGDIASSYNGAIWVEDIEALGPALKQ
jgi:glycerophosphoryl diester phosphodiesterase